jgi:AhpD family alkylhydroperoxidase
MDPFPQAGPATGASSADCYDKPIWSLRALWGALGTLPGHLGRVSPTLVGRPIDGRLREMIMLAVATENRCWYCQTAHAAFGEVSGLGQHEIESLLAGGDDGQTRAERLALGYARDLARRGFASRDERLRAELAAYFDPAAVAAVESTAHVMNFANRFGNTFDAARHRALGRCDRTGASAVDLAVVSAIFVPAAACVAPVVGLLRLRKLVQRRKAEPRRATP